MTTLERADPDGRVNPSAHSLYLGPVRSTLAQHGGSRRDSFKWGFKLARPGFSPFPFSMPSSNPGRAPDAVDDLVPFVESNRIADQLFPTLG